MRKYRWMFKDPDKLTVGDFDEEVFEGFCDKTNVLGMNQLNELTIAFERLDTGEIVHTTDKEFVGMLQERAMDMFLDDLADRIAKRLKGE